jgi:hypothetical protein
MKQDNFHTVSKKNSPAIGKNAVFPASARPLREPVAQVTDTKTTVPPDPKTRNPGAGVHPVNISVCITGSLPLSDQPHMVYL